MKLIWSILLFFTLVSTALADKIVIEFDATWCGPCKALAKALDNDIDGKNLLLQYRGLQKYDIDRFPKTAEKFKISSIPAYLILDIEEKDGKLVTAVKDTWIGEDLDSLKKFLKKNLEKK